jgi:L-2-hydroxyglutarate oxidase
VTLPTEADLVVVGAGIVGLATARAVLTQAPGLDVLVVDKEPRLAAHQSSHNSGVVHAGVYYRPDSLKARLVAEGRHALERYVAERAIPYRRTGKVVVATEADELAPLAELHRRARAHDVEATWLDRYGLAAHEPHVDGLAALHVPATGVVDFPAVCDALHADVIAAGGEVHLGHAVVAARVEADGVTLVLGEDAAEVRSGAVVTCAGLQADLVADLLGVLPAGLRIAPFRGEYFELAPAADHLVRGLVYPVPDPRFPFLGVHLTRGVDGHVHVGPNAVPALAREGYRWSDRDPAELRRWLRDPSSHRLARRYWRSGAAEIVRSRSRRRFVRAARRLVPDLRADDLVPGGAGVRAQALAPDGTLLDDFAFGESPRVVAVLNAPSPAATACLAIGAHVAARVLPELRPDRSGPPE